MLNPALLKRINGAVVQEIDRLVGNGVGLETLTDSQAVHQAAPSPEADAEQRREQKSRRIEQYQRARRDAGPHYEYVVPTVAGRDIRRETGDFPAPDALLALKLEAGTPGKHIEISFGNWEQVAQARHQIPRSVNYLVVSSEDEDWATATAERLKKAVEPCERPWPGHLRGLPGDAITFALFLAIYAFVGYYLGTWTPRTGTLFLTVLFAALFAWATRSIRARLFPIFEYEGEHKGSRSRLIRHLVSWILVGVAFQVALSVVGNRVDAALFGG